MSEHQDGIYFNMPEDEYHEIQALSASGMKDLEVSLLEYWTKRFDPDYVRTESAAMLRGKAYHKRVLEGSPVFENEYACAFDPDVYPNALRTQNDLKVKCKELELPVSGTKPDLIARLLKYDPVFEFGILDCLIKKHDEQCEGRTQLPLDDYHQVMHAVEILERSDLMKHFSGGYPEVVIIWTCPVTGVKCKARYDYLSLIKVVDLKTFANKMRKPIEVAASQAVAYERYNLQACHYMNGLETFKANRERRIFVDGKANVSRTADEFVQALIGHEHYFLFVFQETGQINNCIARAFRPVTANINNEYWSNSQDIVHGLSRLYKNAMEKFGTEHPWVEPQFAYDFDDANFPIWMTQ